MVKQGERDGGTLPLVAKNSDARDDSIQALIAKYGMGRQVGTACAVAASGHAELIEELARAGMAYAHVARVMQAEYDIKVKDHSVGRHMRRDCLCQTK